MVNWTGVIIHSLSLLCTVEVYNGHIYLMQGKGEPLCQNLLFPEDLGGLFLLLHMLFCVCVS